MFFEMVKMGSPIQSHIKKEEFREDLKPKKEDWVWGI